MFTGHGISSINNLDLGAIISLSNYPISASGFILNLVLNHLIYILTPVNEILIADRFDFGIPSIKF